jgi:hypothetical protein
MNKSGQADATLNRPRLIAGSVLLIGGFLSPLLVPLVLDSNLSGSWKTLLSTGLVVGIPEVAMLAAVAVLGKQGFELIKQRVFALLKRHTEASAVSATRYRIGLIMFFLPLVLGWLLPYATHFFPDLLGSPDAQSLKPMIIFDLVFATSFLVLGAGFWDKIQSLFIHQPGESPASRKLETGSGEQR